MRHEPMPVTMRITAPIRQASAEVSPMLPGSRPPKATSHGKSWCDAGGCIWRNCDSTVAPEKPSCVAAMGTAVQTGSPDMLAG